MFSVVEADAFSVEPDADLEFMLPETRMSGRRKRLRSVSDIKPSPDASPRELVALLLKAREELHDYQDLANLLGCRPNEICRPIVSTMQRKIPEFNDVQDLIKDAALLESATYT